MATNKKRKVDASNGPQDISAFARLRLVPNDKVISYGENQQDRSEEPSGSQDEQLFSIGSLKDSDMAHRLFQTGPPTESRDRSQENTLEVDHTSNTLGGENDTSLHLVESRASGGRDLDVAFTTVDLTGGNFRQIDGGNCVVEIAAGERLVVLGEYGLSVLAGQVTILGATLSTSDTIYEVYAPLSHSLPVITYSTSEKNKAEICLHYRSHGLRALGRLSPLFAGIWSLQSSHQWLERSGSVNQQGNQGIKQRSFHIISSADISPHQTVYPVMSSPEWNEQLHASTLSRMQPGRDPVIMICGPKSSGKSTFARMLVNHLVAGKPLGSGPKADVFRRENKFIAFLDLDPGQPEYSPPGQVSLLRISGPQFGPPFSHPDDSDGRELVRAHSIAAISPSADPSLYMSCAVELLSCYLNMLTETACPLVINTPGWVLGSGLEMLLGLIHEARPSQILYMSQQGPSEAIGELQQAAKQIPLVTLPSQPTSKITRTAAQLRKMQFMSYFHLDPTITTGHFWKDSPITSMAPWEVRYAGDGAGILGVMCLGEPPSLEMVRDTIDGTVLAVVVLDDIAAISASGDDGFRQAVRYHKESVEYEGDAKSDNKTTKEWIIQTPEGIPYINPEYTTSLNPKYSHTVGLALLRAVDKDRKVFQLLTPISETTIKDTHASRKAIVLVGGKLDIPSWAYLEAFHEKAGVVTDTRSEPDPCRSDDDSEDSAVEQGEDCMVDTQNLGQDSPWIEKSHGDRGRGTGARVWRVRRDLR